jgi:hypothetical protein
VLAEHGQTNERIDEGGPMRIHEVGKAIGLSLLSAVASGAAAVATPPIKGAPLVMTAPFHAGCQTRSIACGQTMAGTLEQSDCQSGDGSYMEFWEFSDQGAQSLTIDQRSTAVDSLVSLYNANEQLVSANDDGGGGFNARILQNLTQHGNWSIAASSFASGSTGAYTVSLACNDTQFCDSSPSVLCLNNRRFKVRATFAASNGQAGAAQAERFTDQTGYFWFFGRDNVEAVVKVLDGCSLNNRFWVFAGGLTDVNTVITVTDTENNIDKTYSNPQGTPFQPVQDTNAFANCP